MNKTKPWLHEPNEAVFIYKGYKCAIVRLVDMLHLCGYVAIPKGHKIYRKINIEDKYEVHGGITFDERGTDKETHEKIRLIGFHCGNSYDYIPQLALEDKYYSKYFNPENYRTIEFVTKEIHKLVDQLEITK